MTDKISKWAMMAMLAAPLAYLSERRYRKLPQLPISSSQNPLPSLSIIVPARNEADNLHHLLPSLSTKSYPGFLEVIVVDDNSWDDTASIASSHGTRVIQLGDPPPDWLGKPYACHQGATAATGEWLLFTDADTVHHPNGPASSVRHALTNRFDGLSIFVKHSTTNGLDSLVLLVAFAGLSIGLDKSNSIINGQYILLHRDAYMNSGGFARVARESMEDLALGHRLRNLGYKVPLIRSNDVAFVRMYTDKRSLWQGMVRIGSGSLRWLGLRSIITAIFITGVMSPILALIAALRLKEKRLLALTSWAAIAIGILPWARRFKSPWLALLAPIGALIVQAASLWGLVRRLIGRGMPWKERRV